MRKSTGRIKRTLSLFLVVLMSIESFAAVVSDIDGAAFITKAEFDSLKNSFQSQLDQYNRSIDSKIDGSIASYLAGITVSTTQSYPFYDGLGSRVLVCETNKINDLKWGRIDLDITATSVHFPYETQMRNADNVTSISVLTVGINRNVDDPFEVFRYNSTNKRLVAYSDDLVVNVVIDSLYEESGSWAFMTSKPTTFRLRWHGRWSDDRNALIAMKRNDYTKEAFVIDDLSGSSTCFNTWLDCPNWLACYPSGINLPLQGHRGQPVRVNKYSVTDEIERETQILTIMDDIDVDLTNKLWTPSDKNDTIIATKCLNSDWNNDSSRYAINYNKVNRTLSYDTPQGSDVNLVLKYGQVCNNRGGYYSELTSYNDTAWGKYGSHNAYATSGTVTSAPWWEPYFDNDSVKSSDITNASVTSVILDTYNKYGFTGKLTEGIPIVELNTDETAEFNILLPAALVIGAKTTPFNANEYVRNAVADNNIDFNIDGVKVDNYASKEVSAGLHKVKIINHGEKCAIFFKLGRTASNSSTTNRYKVTLPYQINVTRQV